MSTKTRLVSQTFIDELHNQQELAKKKYVVLKKVNFEKQNRKKLFEKEAQKSRKDEFMVFNYLWHHFPEAMAFNMTFENWKPGCMRLVMENSEFERILKAAKRYYGFWGFISSIPTLSFLALTGLTFSLETGFFAFYFFAAMLSGIIATAASPFLFPDDLTKRTASRRKRLLALYNYEEK